MKDITCGELRRMIESQPDSMPVRFALNGQENTQVFVRFDDCFETDAAFWIAVRLGE